MNQLGGVVATLLAGLLATISWRLSFLVYLFGLISIVLVLLYLPNEKLLSRNAQTPAKKLLKYHASIIGMPLVMMIFFIFPAYYAIIATKQGVIPSEYIPLIMVAYDVVAFFVGMLFGKILIICRESMKYFTLVLFLCSYLFFELSPSLSATIIALLLAEIANGIGIPFIYEEATAFENGLAIVKRNGKYGIVNQNFEEIIPPMYDELLFPSEGFVSVQKDSKYGVVNLNNELVVDFLYDRISRFHEGYASAGNEWKSGFIDTEGKLVIDLKFDYANSFQNGISFVMDGDHGYYINKLNQTIFESIR